MSLRCGLFGHKPPTYFGEHSQLGGGNYLRTDGAPIIDGIGRSHFALIGTCSRCGEPYMVGMIHGSEITKHLQEAKYGALVEALEQIERWDGFPSTDKTWEGSGEPVSYVAAFGSNGERDFMREVARTALASHKNNGGKV